MPVAAAIAEHAALTIEVPGGVLHFTGSSRSSWTDRRGRPMVGFEFDPGQHAARARLALALFGAAEPFDAEPVIEAKPTPSKRKRSARVETAA
jgi:hypothetical protein